LSILGCFVQCYQQLCIYFISLFNTIVVISSSSLHKGIGIGKRNMYAQVEAGAFLHDGD